MSKARRFKTRRQCMMTSSVSCDILFQKRHRVSRSLSEANASDATSKKGDSTYLRYSSNARQICAGSAEQETFAKSSR
eukprot:5767867-Pleurochrysis_carterae.AAC.1